MRDEGKSIRNTTDMPALTRPAVGHCPTPATLVPLCGRGMPRARKEASAAGQAMSFSHRVGEGGPQGRMREEG
jgi:hypothetical protein